MLLPWDRLNLLKTQVETLTIEYEWDGVKRKRIRPRECVDLILDWLIECYLLGDEYVHESFSDPGFGSDMGRGTVDTDEMYETIYKKVAGKNFDQRVREYATTGDIESIMRVAETDATRVFNESELKTAQRVGATSKTWNTMADLRVRDTQGTVWFVELGNPGRTTRSGFGADTADIGDTVTVIGNRDQDHAKAHMKAVRIVIDGRNYDMYPERLGAE